MSLKTEISPELFDWDKTRKELRYGGVLAKRFSWPAPSSFYVLDSFDRAGWPDQLPNPFYQEDFNANLDQDLDALARATVRSLNRIQINEILHFGNVWGDYQTLSVKCIKLSLINDN